MMLALTAVLIPLTTIATSLRFVARAQTKAKLGLDDLFAFLSLFTFCAFVASIYWAENVFMSAGIGTSSVSLVRWSEYLKAFWVGGVLAPTPISCAKFSILFLYRRLFSRDRNIDFAIKITGLLCLSWWIAATVASALSCIPVQKAWEPQTWTPIPGLPETSGFCYDYPRYYLGIEIPNCILDFWVVAMPVFEIQKLQLSLQYKISISFIFVLAGFVGIISIVRMVVVSPTAGPYNANIGLWIVIQLAFAVICCSLPTFKPLVAQKSQLRSWFSSIGSLLSRGGHSTGQSTGNSFSTSGISTRSKRRNKYEDLHTDDLDDLVTSTEVVGGKAASGLSKDYPVNSIKMTNSFNVV